VRPILSRNPQALRVFIVICMQEYLQVYLINISSDREANLRNINQKPAETRKPLQVFIVICMQEYLPSRNHTKAAVEYRNLYLFATTQSAADVSERVSE
jgi:hypothetical protein